MRTTALFVVLFFAFASCRFVDVTSQAGIDYEQQPSYSALDNNCLTQPCYIQDTTGGAAIADFDGDGWPDIYVTRLMDRDDSDQITLVSDILYKNQGDGTFRDVTDEVGLGGFKWFTVAPLFCDFDNDGDLDLYVTTVCPTQFMEDDRNHHYLFIYENGRYIERTSDWNIGMRDGRERVGMAASCGDLNKDGYMDMFVSQWTPRPASEVNFIDYAPHTRMLLNNDGSNFKDVTNTMPALNVIIDREHNFAGEFVDFDKDGDVDLLVSADFNHSQFFRNLGGGDLMDFTEASNCCEGSNDMGTAFGDIDNNGRLDWFLTSMGLNDQETSDPTKVCVEGDLQCGNRLYMGGQNGKMLDNTEVAGVRRGGWGWGAAFFDVENDGDLDLAMTNGHWTLPDTGSNGVFWENVDGVMNGLHDSTDELNFMDKYGFGLAILTFDFDKDGDLDVFISHAVDGGTLFRNDLDDDEQSNDYIKVKAIGMGAPQGTNYFGKGAQITIMNRGIIYYQEMGVGSPLLGHSENTIAHFGLGDCPGGKLDSISVWFPVTDTTYYEENVECNRMIQVHESDAVELSSFSTGSSDSSDSSDSSSNSSNSSSSSASWVIPSMLLVALCLMF